MFQIKERLYDYFSTISILGVPGIFTANYILLKILWSVVILGLAAVGFWNIALAVNDFYNYDVITNIERVTPDEITFPAITICYRNYYKDHYINNIYVGQQYLKTGDLKFKDFITFMSSSWENIDDYLDYFKVSNSDYIGCMRFNAATNKSRELLTAPNTDHNFFITFTSEYRETISMSEYYKYRITWIEVYITDNYLNSFENLSSSIVPQIGKVYDTKIEKPSIELKLPEPYNQCKEYLYGDEPFHRLNCIEECVYKEIKNKYKCTFLGTLFAMEGLQDCFALYVKEYTNYKNEFWTGCQKECPLESCFSEKFSSFMSTDNKIIIGLSQTVFSFSFRDLSSLNISQIPKTDGFTFINNIGGGLGPSLPKFC